MKFRKIYVVCWEVLIDEEWYYLGVCKNCGEVHAGNNGYIIDKKIKCCERPNNWRYREDNSMLIEEFVNKWSDEE